MTPSNTPLIRRDTSAWRLQVWLSFGIAVSLCAIGLSYLPGDDIDRAFMVMGYVFCLSTAFALAKFVRDNQHRPVDTPMWKLVVWAGFFFAMALTGWGLYRMDIQPVWKAYLLVCWLFLISQVFTLAKTLRDAHDADLLEARLAGRRESSEAPMA
ncbi:YiaA/YiaB family inner membrane protein [Aquabacterium humicola]|uniref:YiaA/YiaB family inner membrane protein n=1 Tax=Aquabacterium humicola TaxID=3237377 RepID=UPI0025439BD1|nr:YiaA/YiaB family inner membrane protein [Rubrivivax pictus]